MNTRINYRKLAFKTYPPICAYCGFGVPEVLEVAHIDGNRDNNVVENLAILCPNCHKMLDIDLIPTETIVLTGMAKMTPLKMKLVMPVPSPPFPLSREERGTVRRYASFTLMCDREKRVVWSKRMKDAGAKAAATRKRKQTARKAVETRKRNASS